MATHPAHLTTSPSPHLTLSPSHHIVISAMHPPARKTSFRSSRFLIWTCNTTKSPKSPLLTSGLSRRTRRAHTPSSPSHALPNWSPIRAVHPRPPLPPPVCLPTSPASGSSPNYAVTWQRVRQLIASESASISTSTSTSTFTFTVGHALRHQPASHPASQP
jgi:hypothetical protein